MAYGLGELWLRLGDVRTAATWFERVTDEIVDQVAQQCLARRGRATCEGFQRCVTIGRARRADRTPCVRYAPGARSKPLPRSCR